MRTRIAAQRRVPRAERVVRREQVAKRVRQRRRARRRRPRQRAVDALRDQVERGCVVHGVVQHQRETRRAAREHRRIGRRVAVGRIAAAQRRERRGIVARIHVKHVERAPRLVYDRHVHGRAVGAVAHTHEPGAQAVVRARRDGPGGAHAVGRHATRVGAQRKHTVHPVARGIDARLEQHALLQRRRRLHTVRRAHRRASGVDVRGVDVHRARRRRRARGDERGERPVLHEVRGTDHVPGGLQLRAQRHGAHRVEPERLQRHMRTDLRGVRAAERRQPRDNRLRKRVGEYRRVVCASVAASDARLPRDEVERIVGGAHRAPVDLGTRRARKGREHEKVKRHHVRGQQTLGALAQRARKRRRLVVGAQKLVRVLCARVRGAHGERDDARRLVRRRAGHRDRVGVAHGGRSRLDSRIDLEQLDAHAMDLDLVVVAAQVLKLAVPEPPREVARVVQPAEPRVLDKLVARLVCVADVAARELRTAEQQLADRAERRDVAVPVEHDAQRRVKRHADVVRLDAVAVRRLAHRERERGLGRPVNVHEAAVARPLVRDGLGQLLAAVDHEPHRRDRAPRHHRRDGRCEQRMRDAQRHSDVHKPRQQQVERRKAHRPAMRPRVEHVKDR